MNHEELRAIVQEFIAGEAGLTAKDRDDFAEIVVRTHARKLERQPRIGFFGRRKGLPLLAILQLILAIWRLFRLFLETPPGVVFQVPPGTDVDVATTFMEVRRR